MIKSFKSTLYVLLGSSLVLSSAIASNRVPTDVKLADDQTFTYRILDEHSSVDPQVVTE
jgi:oligopeptide transport system substrate-binding protein